MLALWIIPCLAAAALAVPVKTTQQDVSQNVTEKSAIMKAYDGCPAGFVRSELIPDYCYRLVLEGFTFWEAYTNCKSYEADLAYIQSAEEQGMLESYIKNEDINWSVMRLGSIWIGLRKDGHSPWSWAKPGVELSYTNWPGTEPPFNIWESCVFMSSETFLWDGSYCHSYRAGIDNGGAGSESHAVMLRASLCKAAYQEPTLNNH